MTDSTIKIYNARYSKLMKLLDFIAVNLFIFAYLKYFFVEPSTASLFLGIIYSLILSEPMNTFSYILVSLKASI